MINIIKNFIIIPGFYIGIILTIILSVFKKTDFGLYLLIAIIPLPNIWRVLFKYPMGKDLLDILILAIIIGLFIKKRVLVAKTKNSNLILAFILLNYVSLWNISLRFSLPLPITKSNYLLFDFKNYVEMIFLYFLFFNEFESERQHKIIVVLISIIILFISVRNLQTFSTRATFSYSTKRAGGPFWAVGLGANHFAAFIVQYCAFLLGLLFFEDDKKYRLLYLATVLFGLHPLLFSYSRGGYLAAFVTVAILSIIKRKWFVVAFLVVLLFSWKTILPSSVIDRIQMTTYEDNELEASAAQRLILWNYAFDIFRNNPIFGIGFGGFRFAIPETEKLIDTHNYFIKTLCEQGIIGLLFLVFIFVKALKSGWELLSIGKNNFYKGLGLGFVGCVIACIITNLFGDRWSQFVLGSYFWILWGLIDRSILISQAHKEELISDV